MSKEFPKIESEKTEEEIGEEKEEKTEKFPGETSYESSFEGRIEKCCNKIEDIAGEIDELACNWESQKNAGTASSLLEKAYERPINVLSAQLAAKKAQLEILERKLDEEKRVEEESINR